MLIARKTTLFSLACALAWFSINNACAEMPRIDLAIGLFRIDAEVAANQADRTLGLMNRRSMATNRGMLFVFANADQHCMWMRNTLIPLSVAFMDRDGRILNIENMQANTDDSHCASAPATFALEMNQHWFAEKELKTGMIIRGLDRAPAAR